MTTSDIQSRDSTRRWRTRASHFAIVLISFLALEASIAGAFVPSSRPVVDFSTTNGRICKEPKQSIASQSFSKTCQRNIGRYKKPGPQSSRLFSFMGSDGGILGIGTPELFTILLVGYFVLGPSDLYKLTKEIGKAVQNLRTFTTDATATLENSFESQLQLEEIRKAQRELTDAFSFRRSINVEEDTDPFEVNAKSPRPMEEGEVIGTEAVSAGVPSKKKRIRRVKKKVTTEEPTLEDDSTDDPFGISDQKLANNVPDLDLDDDNDDLFDAEQRAMKSMQAARDELFKEEKAAAAKDAAAQTRKDRMDRLQRAQQSGEANGEAIMAEQSRFQQQLSGDWNNQILANANKLDPLASIMERLAVLEEEKVAADKRLQEEFQAREENEERFYREKRELLEEAAAEIQASAYASTTATTTASSSTTSSGSNSTRHIS